jgi:hypothetical protein
MSDQRPVRPPRRTDATRRQLLVAAGGLSLATLFHVAPARADDADQTRLATLAALLAAMACGPGGETTDEIASAYVERYAVFHDEADPHFRAYADAALDEVGAAGIRFLDPPAALAAIRSWAEDGQHAARAAAALDLTRLCFEEDEARQAGYALSRS